MASETPNYPSARIAAFMAEQSEYTGRPVNRGRKKTCSIERIADLYLAALAEERTEPVFLNDFLDEQNIFYTPESIDACLNLLKGNGFVTSTETGFSTFKISQNRDAWAHRRAESFVVRPCLITDSGIHFSRAGQELDSVGRVERLAEKKKWQERLITAAIAIATALLTTVVKEYFTAGK